MNFFRLFTSILLLSISLPQLNAITIHVPADQPTIQAGVDAAADGDTVLVADGTYTGVGNRDVDFLGKSILLVSENGPGHCIIDCEGSDEDPHRGFLFINQENESSILHGFTITNGHEGQGGGIRCNDSSPRICGNIIKGNVALDGGGIYSYGASPTIRENTLVENTAAQNAGGIFCYLGSPTIAGNIISENITTQYSGGGDLPPVLVPPLNSYCYTHG